MKYGIEVSKILKVSVIIVAAGKGRRMGRNYNKQYILLEEKPILAHTIEVFESSSYIDEIILVVGKNEVNLVQENIVEKYSFKKIVSIVEGGAERQDSVYNGLQEVSSDCSIVLVHDGARPFLRNEIIEEGIQVAKKSDACIVAVPVKDTIKVINENMEVVETPNRETLWAVQTPQIFKYTLLQEAYKKAKVSKLKVTDDAMLVESLGYPIKIIQGDYENIKITTPEDLILGQGILEKRKVGI